MKLPRDLSGRELAAGLCRHWDYRQVHQVGSHISLETATPRHQRIAIPDHKSLKVGTLNNILRAVASHKGVTREKILESIL
jgi:predicted RNA binding protein YcfA (HicA-like mRNA interferase family)